jgi:hypothetical protein
MHQLLETLPETIHFRDTVAPGTGSQRGSMSHPGTGCSIGRGPSGLLGSRDAGAGTRQRERAG